MATGAVRIVVHLPGDEVAEYRHLPSAPLALVAGEVAAEIGVPAHTVFFEDAASGRKFDDAHARVGDLFPGAVSVGLIAQCDPRRARPPVPGREGESEDAGKLGAHRAGAGASAAAPAPPPSYGPAHSRPLVPISPRAPPPHVVAALSSPPMSARGATPPTSARGNAPAAGALAPMPPIPPAATIAAVTAACREVEPPLVAVLDRVESRAPAAPAAPSAAAAPPPPAHALPLHERAALMGTLPGVRSAVLRRHGYTAEGDFRAACLACTRAASALTDRAAAPAALQQLPPSSNVAETTALNADAILQSTGLGLAAVWANKLAKADDRASRALASIGQELATSAAAAAAAAAVAGAHPPGAAAAASAEVTTVAQSAAAPLVPPLLTSVAAAAAAAGAVAGQPHAGTTPSSAAGSSSDPSSAPAPPPPSIRIPRLTHVADSAGGGGGGAGAAGGGPTPAALSVDSNASGSGGAPRKADSVNDAGGLQVGDLPPWALVAMGAGGAGVLMAAGALLAVVLLRAAGTRP
jgi:DNA segregation ATPase FtsK/SpoIIIE, S-DNA-T family